MKLNPEVFERAAEDLFKNWPNNSCCSRISRAVEWANASWTEHNDLFEELYDPRDSSPFWWPLYDGTKKTGRDPRVFALLLAAEVCRDELDPKRHKPAKKAAGKKDAWAKKTPHERLSDLVGAVEAARISKGRK